MTTQTSLAARGARLFDETHHELRRSVRRFLEQEVVGQLDEWEKTFFPLSIFKRFGELGFLGLRMPEEYGGQGGDYFTSVVLAEELNRAHTGGLSIAVATHSEVVLPPVEHFGSVAQKEQFLKPGIAGDVMAAIAMTEPDAGSDLARIATSARRMGSDYVINGRKIFITNGSRCGWCLVATRTNPEARTSGALTLFLVPKETPGFVVTRVVNKLGNHSSDTAELLFEDCRVPVEYRLGDEGEGWGQLMWQLLGERLISAAGHIAGAQAVFEYALEYAKNRTAFGQPIGQFQVIKHRLVDMGTSIAAAQALIYDTCERFAAGEPVGGAISQSKLLAAQICSHVADDAIQILGGHGYMEEFPVARAWRDMRLARIGAGTDEIMKEVIARSYGL